MKPSLLLLTNLQNSDPEEDLFLADYLKSWYEVTVAHPLAAEKYEDNADLILVRNIWPCQERIEEYQKINQRFLKKNLPVYNPPTGSGDMQGKEYLVKLWQSGWPVIPTIQSVAELDTLPSANDYMVKPLNGGSGYGIKRLSRALLLEQKIKGCIIQPALTLAREASFYFIDGKLQFALATINPYDRWHLKPFEPTPEQKICAQKFVDWNTLPRGIQRIDFGITADGEFLLMEIEDWCPYLSLLDIDEQLRTNFLDNLVLALGKVVQILIL